MARQTAVRMLTDVAQNRTDAAARELGALMAQGKQLEEKLALLLKYRDDYQARFREAVKKGLDKAGWDNFHGFMDKLDAAIEQQQAGVAQLRKRMNAGETKWREARRTLESYDVLSRRYERTEARRLAQREQREQDEHATKTRTSGPARAGRD
jgi:flagellar protein FliJ